MQACFTITRIDQLTHFNLSVIFFGDGGSPKLYNHPIPKARNPGRPTIIHGVILSVRFDETFNSLPLDKTFTIKDKYTQKPIKRRQRCLSIVGAHDLPSIFVILRLAFNFNAGYFLSASRSIAVFLFRSWVRRLTLTIQSSDITTQPHQSDRWKPTEFSMGTPANCLIPPYNISIPNNHGWHH